MASIKGWLRQWLIDYTKERYTKKMLRYKKIADYNLHRHNEAVTNYNQKRQNRSSSFSESINIEMGFFIADEGADLAAKNYNENWDLYIKYKQKLEVLGYNENSDGLLNNITASE